MEPSNWALQVLGGRWFVLMAVLFVMEATGGTYIFGVYSDAMRASLGYDQKMLNTLGFFKNLGGSLGILPGLINDHSPPWVVMVCGAGLNLAGYVMVYLAIVRRRAPGRRMWLYMVVGAISQCFLSTGALSTAVRNFPGADRGGLLGMILGFAGLSGAIFTQLHRSFAGVGDDGAAAVMLIACLPTAVSLLFTPTIRPIQPIAAGTPGQERRALKHFLRVSIVLGVYLLAVNVVELKVPSFPKPAYYVTAIVLVLLLVTLPLIIVVRQEMEIPTLPLTKDMNTPTALAPTDETPPPESADAASTSTTTSTLPLTTYAERCFPDAASTTTGRPARGQDHSILQALCSVDMLVLLVTTICGIGGLMTAIDNISQIGESLGYAQGTISMVVSLLSLSNYAGRVVVGFGSGYLLKHKVPRPLAVTAVLLLACVGHLIVAFGVRNGLYAASLLIGFCIGAQWTVVFAIISEVFGLQYFSTLYNLGTLATPVGSYILNVQLTGRLYDREARLQAWPRGICCGVRCFRGSFLIITCVTLFGAALSLVLVWRTKEFYNSLSFTNSRAAVDPGEIELTRR
ncbi:hypothetical protein EJB05_40680, partial [Eragrostis curvula]